MFLLKLCRMSMVYKTAGAFTIGVILMTGMIGGSRPGSATFLKIAAPRAAGELLHRVGKYPEANTSNTPWRKLAAEEFERDFDRMEWTWDREIQWKSNPSLQP